MAHAPRRARDPRLNLASNELIHPAVPGLHQEMLADFDPDGWRLYPAVADAARAVAGLFGVDEDALTMTPGSDAAIRLLLAALAEPLGRRLIVQTPNYDAWWTARDAAHWTITEAASPDGTADGSLRALTRAVRAAPPSLVVMSWPNGPAGYTPPLDDVGRLAAECADRGHLLVVDACYSGFTADPRRLMGLAGEHFLVLLSWSKLFGLAGARLAVAFSSATRTLDLRSWGRERELPAVGLHLLARTPEVYDRFAGVWRDVAQERNRFCALIGDRGWAVRNSGGNFFSVLMPSAARAAEVAAAVSEAGYRIRDLTGVAAMPPAVRISVACGTVNNRFGPLLLEALAGRRHSVSKT